MAMYKFYAVLEPTDEGNILVTFPDLENVFTQGEDLKDAVDMAEDALGMMLADMEENNEQIPPASPVESLKVPQGASVVLIETDTDTDNHRDDAEVIISPSEKNHNKSSLQFDMAKNTVEAVQAEVKEVREKAGIVTFSNFVENAVLHYLDSEQWQRVKKGFLDSNNDW